MSYRIDWSDDFGHMYVIASAGGSPCCWFCLCEPDSRAARKVCLRNPEMTAHLGAR